MREPPYAGRILLTGASGYVGGRMAPRLLEAGYSIRCLVRSPEKVMDRPWAQNPNCEIVGADLTNASELTEKMRGCDSAYYLVHSMLAAGSEYAERDREMAATFALAAERAGLKRIIYLGGLGETGPGLSAHLQSRREVEAVLCSGSIPVTVLRAAMIIGSGSASFEILRYLVERLPVMVTPKWVSTESQPISIENVIGYLLMCLTTPQTAGKTLDIGGPDIMSYRQIMEIMARVRGLPKRIVIPVPLLTPRLSSLWIHLVTPLSSQIARPLAEGLKNRVVCRDDEASRLMPQRLLGVEESITLALRQEDSGHVETAWSMAGEVPGDPDWAGGKTFVDRREIEIGAPRERVFQTVCRVGGTNGWYSSDWLWRIRGMLDRLVGGPGLSRGRRDSEQVCCGDAIDFWRVVGVRQNELLKLRAEMKLPGDAFLQFEVTPLNHKRSKLIQTARFRPRGLAGLAYWYAVWPLHNWVFSGMLKGLMRAAIA